MSQRNPMNERYTTEKKVGSSRKSAASAKPKSKAAASVTMGTAKKTPQERKQQQKEARKQEAARQKELDRKYYKPDTPQYKKLRRIWWLAIVGAVLCTGLSWLLRTAQPDWLPTVCLFGAYALIIFAFYIDFSKIRKERRAYQERMVALEQAQAKEERARERAHQHTNNKHKHAAKNTKKIASEEVVVAEEVVEEEPKKGLGRFFGKKASPKTSEQVSE